MEKEYKFELGKFIRDYPHGRASTQLMNAMRWLMKNRLSADWGTFDTPHFLGAPEEIYAELEGEEIDYIIAWGNLYKLSGESPKKQPEVIIRDPIDEIVQSGSLSYHEFGFGDLCEDGEGLFE